MKNKNKNGILNIITKRLLEEKNTIEIYSNDETILLKTIEKKLNW